MAGESAGGACQQQLAAITHIIFISGKRSATADGRRPGDEQR